MKHKPPSDLEGWDPARLDLLRAYERLLRQRAVSLGAVSAGDRDRLWDRHILDSTRAAACIPCGATFADLGSGAGLPGVPLAIVRPDLTAHLVEARSKRASFLELVVETLGLTNVDVVVARVEQTDLDVEVCLARALAPPETAWQLAAGLLVQGGVLIYWAGRSWGLAYEKALAAAGATTEVCAAPSAEWQGSVVKIARTVQFPDPDSR